MEHLSLSRNSVSRDIHPKVNIFADQGATQVAVCFQQTSVFLFSHEYIYIKHHKTKSGKCLTPSQLLICSSFSRENGYLLPICSKHQPVIHEHIVQTGRMESEFSKPQTFADSSYKSQKLIFEQFLIGRGQRFFLKPRYGCVSK